MKQVVLLMEQDEIMVLRMQARMMELMMPETNEMVDNFIKKILDSTNDLISPEYRKEIGKMQRAIRIVKTTQEYGEFMDKMNVLQKIIAKEMQKQE
jgi:hypothetical protein